MGGRSTNDVSILRASGGSSKGPGERLRVRENEREREFVTTREDASQGADLSAGERLSSFISCVDARHARVRKIAAISAPRAGLTCRIRLATGSRAAGDGAPSWKGECDEVARVKNCGHVCDGADAASGPAGVCASWRRRRRGARRRWRRRLISWRRRRRWRKLPRRRRGRRTLELPRWWRQLIFARR
jgi:hypothetical protein